VVKFLLRNKIQTKKGTSMDIRITQLITNFITEYVGIFEDCGRFTFESFESDLQRMGTEFFRRSMEVFPELLDEQLVASKEARKEAGITIHKRKVSREVLSKFGLVNFKRTYFKTGEEYAFLTDKVVGLESYDRISPSLTAELVDKAGYMSYQKSACETTDSYLSRQTVMNKIRRTKGLELVLSGKKEEVKVLHVVADEDHVAMQSGKNRIVPLITVHEGIEYVSKRRNRCINARHFCDYDKSTKDLWDEVSAWMAAEYEMDKVERIYLHGDGAHWIKKGLEVLPDCKFVLDKFHLKKAIKSVTGVNKEEYYLEINEAFQDCDLEGFGETIDEMFTIVEDKKEAEKLSAFRTYVLNNWEGIEIRQKEPRCGGSCTEAQISHVLAERLSRNPLGWSEEGLGYMSRLRVYKVNGGKVTTRNFAKKNEEKEQSELEKLAILRTKQIFIETRNYDLFDVKSMRNGKATPLKVILEGINKAGQVI